jgi:mono/diheme cytochrome c family protein
MNEQEKQEYLEQYKQAKEHGVPFFPDALVKDAIVALIVFGILVALATFVGAPLEARADPADTSYTPRPEWYFLFLFQLLKYFPGELEVIGVFVIPTLVVILLFVLPFLDRSPRRHFLGRLGISGVTLLAMAGIVFLTIQALREAPPPAEAAEGDATAALYTANCSGCHGPSIEVPPGTNLHDVIAQGKHEGMPAWSADLTADQIDALAGFILSPGGSLLFTQNCGACHEAPELVAGDPQELRNALEQGPAYAAHADVEVPDWTESLSQEERIALLNFLVAPDGQRLFVTNCASCHGRAVAFSGEESELRSIISQGGLHLTMPPWREALSDAELDTLARYVVDPGSTPEGAGVFAQYCSSCHGERVPSAADVAQARETIASGGSHETMPVWGNILTPEQLDALVVYTLEAAQGAPVALGQELFAENCATCHGDLGEGGPNPTRSDDVIAPISTAEYLKTRDDATLRSIVSQGQPNFGMSPFGTAFGGPLDDDEIDAIVAYLRSWEANPPVELPPEVTASRISLSGSEVYTDLCTQCHGASGEGGIGPSLRDPTFQAENTDQELFDTINLGHSATPMIAWGEILAAEQIEQLVEYIRQLGAAEPEAPAGIPSFAADVMPIFQANCAVCHGSLGGWDASSYESVMSSGNNAPTVIAGDVDSSLLAQKVRGTQTQGTMMPPSGLLPEDEIQIILDWIAAGAPDN